jgi:hypothetical protein
LELLAGVVFVLALLAPLILGPALGPLAVALGGGAEHRCACGMVQGSCGCPECERIEHQRLHERSPAPYAVLRSQCHDDEATPGAPALPPGIEAPAGFALAAPSSSRAPTRDPAAARSREATEPRTPPPRRSV